MYISNQMSLNSFIESCSDAKYICIDTEFLREKTYYPKLCLIQIATANSIALIDPLSGIDISGLAQLLEDPKIVKVFHAGEQDRSILQSDVGVAVAPIFDTQRAVMLLGLPQQISLLGIVKHFCKVNLPKSESFSDWSQRPLTEKQLLYAKDDVRYLPQIYQQLVKQLRDLGRLEWLEEDMREIAKNDAQEDSDCDVWKRLKGASALDGKHLAIAQAICIWREKQARQRNIPRKWLLADEFMIEIAKKMPLDAKDLAEIRGLKERLNAKNFVSLLEAVTVGHNLPKSEWPKRNRPLTAGLGTAATVDLLSALTHYVCDELHIASTFLTTREELLRLAHGQRSDLEVLKGWRFELLGNRLLSLLAGGTVLSVEGKKIKVETRS